MSRLEPLSTSPATSDKSLPRGRFACWHPAARGGPVVGGSRALGKKQVLFSCTNNPASSQMAEVFRLARQRLRDLIGMDLANGKGR